MSLGIVFLIIPVLMLIGAMPNLPAIDDWGYGPNKLVGLALLLLLVLLVTIPAASP
ncbi:MAG: DUF3309 family protein [Sulfuriferula sp.]|nr:DUF3309 family protein [Sulfuriferula sp.]